MDVIVATSSFLASPGISTWGTLAGETAHAALGLAKGLRALGHRTSLVAPLDAELQRSGIGLARRLSPLSIEIAGTAHERVVFDARLPSGVELVLLGGEPPTEATDPEARALRWVWFGHAVSALARQRLGQARSQGEGELEAVIAVGEGAAATALAIREAGKQGARDGGPSTRLLAGLSRIVVPIEPAADHRLPRAALSSAGIDDALFSPEGIEFYGDASLLKAGILAADRVATLGETTRDALARPSAAHRFDGVFRARGTDVVSIGSGIDVAQYNPATDPHLVGRFDPEDTTGKVRGRSSFVAELELDPAAGLPLLVVVDPIPSELGAALPAALGRALRGEVLVAVVRTAPREAEGELDLALDRLVRTHPGRIVVRHAAPEALLHRAIAAADLLLVLDGAAATGTAARAALRYGAVPIALASPAHEEAIVDLAPSLETGTGILFAGEGDLFGAIQRGVSAYGQPGWPRLVRRAMRIEGGWERAARRLESILQQLEA
jgi:starch synthase